MALLAVALCVMALLLKAITLRWLSTYCLLLTILAMALCVMALLVKAILAMALYLLLTAYCVLLTAHYSPG